MATAERDGVSLTHLDEPLFDGVGATERDLVDYLDAVSGLILPELRGRLLSVIRVRVGQQRPRRRTCRTTRRRGSVRSPCGPNPPGARWRYGALRRPARRCSGWPTSGRWSTSHAEPGRGPGPADPPGAGHRPACRRAVGAGGGGGEADPGGGLDVGLAGAVKTSGSTGLHLYVPVQAGEEAAAATRAIAARAAHLILVLATTGLHQGGPAGRCSWTRPGPSAPPW